MRKFVVYRIDGAWMIQDKKTGETKGPFPSRLQARDAAKDLNRVETPEQQQVAI